MNPFVLNQISKLVDKEMLEWANSDRLISNPFLKCLVDEEAIFEIASSINFDLKSYLSAKSI
jgi:hypothetical protein